MQKASLCLFEICFETNWTSRASSCQNYKPLASIMSVPRCVITGFLPQRRVMIVSNVYCGGLSWFRWKLCSCFLSVSCGFLHDYSIMVRTTAALQCLQHSVKALSARWLWTRSQLTWLRCFKMGFQSFFLVIVNASTNQRENITNSCVASCNKRKQFNNTWHCRADIQYNIFIIH